MTGNDLKNRVKSIGRQMILDNRTPIEWQDFLEKYVDCNLWRVREKDVKEFCKWFMSYDYSECTYDVFCRRVSE